MPPPRCGDGRDNQTGVDFFAFGGAGPDDPDMQLLCRPVVSLVVVALISGGCQATREYYYNAWENFGGYAKRDRRPCGRPLAADRSR